MSLYADVDREKSDFIRRLDESRSATKSSLKGVDPEQLIYAESGWRVKDLIAHLTTWEREVITSLKAFRDGAEYRIPDFISDDLYNEQIFRRYQNTSTDQIYADWDTIRSEFKSAIQAVPAERFNGQVMCPWGLYSGILGIVNDMIGHEAEHLHDIQAVVSR